MRKVDNLVNLTLRTVLCPFMFYFMNRNKQTKKKKRKKKKVLASFHSIEQVGMNKIRQQIRENRREVE